MLVKDLAFKATEKPLIQEARVVFSNGHWAKIYRCVPGFLSPEIDARHGEYEAHTSIRSDAMAYLSEVELNLVLAELRFTERAPLSVNPWDVNV